MSYALLPFVTPTQASNMLESNYRLKLSEEDLYTHCEQHIFHIFLKTGIQKGTSVDSAQECYGVGYQQVLNPDVLRHKTSEVVLQLLGNVRFEPDPESEITSNNEWSVVLKLEALRPAFNRTDLESFAEELNKTPNKVTKAQHLVIAELLAIVSENPKYNQAGLVKKWLTKYETVRGVGESTLNKLLADSNFMKSDIEKALGLI